MDIIINGWLIENDDIPRDKVGRVMHDICFCQAEQCRDKEAFLELLRHTAEKILKR